MSNYRLEPYNEDVILHYDPRAVFSQEEWLLRDRTKALKFLKNDGVIPLDAFTPATGDLLLMHLLEEREDGFYPINDCISILEVMIF